MFWKYKEILLRILNIYSANFHTVLREIKRGRQREKENSAGKIIHLAKGMIHYQKIEFAYCKHTNDYGVTINYSYLFRNGLFVQFISYARKKVMQIELPDVKPRLLRFSN